MGLFCKTGIKSGPSSKGSWWRRNQTVDREYLAHHQEMSCMAVVTPLSQGRTVFLLTCSLRTLSGILVPRPTKMWKIQIHGLKTMKVSVNV